MGQYFEWVNFDKKQFINGAPWECGYKLVENCYIGNEKTDAALTLIASDWAGDLVCFLGDYATFENEVHPGRVRVEQILASADPCCYTFDECEDITGIFKYIETSPYNIKRSDDDDWGFYEGPFTREIVQYRYVVNETKKEFVDRCHTPIRYVHKGKIARYDPFPELLSTDDSGIQRPDKELSGQWVGDVIVPTNATPDKTYREIGQHHTYWKKNPIINNSDEEILDTVLRHGIVLPERYDSDEVRPVLIALETALAADGLLNR